MKNENETNVYSKKELEAMFEDRHTVIEKKYEIGFPNGYPDLVW